jgi:hypothetical protein
MGRESQVYLGEASRNRRVSSSSAIGLASVFHAYDGHRLAVIVDLVEDAMIAYPDVPSL